MFYFTCLKLKWNYFISASERVLKLFQNYFSDIQQVLHFPILRCVLWCYCERSIGYTGCIRDADSSISTKKILGFCLAVVPSLAYISWLLQANMLKCICSTHVIVTVALPIHRRHWWGYPTYSGIALPVGSYDPTPLQISIDSPAAARSSGQRGKRCDMWLLYQSQVPWLLYHPLTL